MKRVAVLSILLFVQAGCSSTSDYLGDATLEATECAKNWKAQGYHFDPNCMTCSQMFRRVAAIRRAEYWKERGYHLDPNLTTREEIDQKVKDIDRARYWREKGYEFDPNCMTAREMDQKAEELDQAKRWEEWGYYYDPNSQTVFLSEQKRTEIKSLASLHVGGGYEVFGSPYQRLSLPKSSSYRWYSQPTYSSPLIAENGSYYGQISEATGRPKTVYVRGYYRKEGTYVRSYYRSRPRR